MVTIPVLHSPVGPTFINATDDGNITIMVPENASLHEPIANFHVRDINGGKYITIVINLQCKCYLHIATC